MGMTMTIERVMAFNGLDVLVARDEGFFAAEGLDLRIARRGAEIERALWFRRGNDLCHDSSPKESPTLTPGTRRCYRGGAESEIRGTWSARARAPPRARRSLPG